MGVSDGPFLFETPGMTLEKSKTALFEFVMLKAEELDKFRFDDEVFEEYEEQCDKENSLVTFQNFAKDATIIAACPIANHGGKCWFTVADLYVYTYISVTNLEHFPFKI